MGDIMPNDCKMRAFRVFAHLVMAVGALAYSPVAFGETIEWEAAHLMPQSLEFDELRFTNRARCALDSKQPTTSAFLLIDNMDIAKAAHRLANQVGKDRKAFTRSAIETYRNSIVEMVQLIEQGLFTGRLPLLPVIEEGRSKHRKIPKDYARAIESCEGTQYCSQLDGYLKRVWNAAMVKGGSVESVQKRVMKLDSFDRKKGFIVREKRVKQSVYPWEKNITAPNPSLACRTIHKFSALQAPLFGTKPNAGVLGTIALAATKGQEGTGNCSDHLSIDSGLKAITLKFSLVGNKAVKWDKVGFDFWNSLNTYLAWAWRHSPQLTKFAAPFTKVLRGVRIEDEIMFVPNGCGSMLPPSCAQETTAENMIREFAKRGFSKDRIDLDVMSAFPDGAEQDMLEDPFATVNADILDLGKSAKAYEWVSHFYDNFRGARHIVRSRLRNAINFLNITATKVDGDKIYRDLRRDYDKKLKSARGRHNNLDHDYKEELYYLCSEYLYAFDKEFSLGRDKLALVEDLGMMDDIIDQIAVKSLSEYYAYYDSVGDNVMKFCNKIDMDKIYGDDPSEIDRSGQSQWYLEKALELKIPSEMGERAKKLARRGKVYLAYKRYKKSKEFSDVICATSYHCARKTLSSLISIYRSAQYVHAFWDLRNKIKSPELFNPYAERTSCKVYDPWYKTKAVLFEFATGLGQAGMSFANPAFAFTSVRLEPGRVVSFKQLVKEGKIEYDISYEQAKIKAGLVAELGPLIGVPCAISITRSKNPYQYLRFGGVGVNATACNERTENVIKAYSGGSTSDNVSRTNAQCLSCKLNFEGVVGSTATVAPQLMGGPFFIARALRKLYNGLRDPQNIPLHWDVNIHHLVQTYRRFGEVPEKCEGKLLKGGACLSVMEEQMMKQLAEAGVPGQFMGIRIDGVKAYVTLNTCPLPFRFLLRFRTSSSDSMAFDLQEEDQTTVRKGFLTPKKCRHLL